MLDKANYQNAIDLLEKYLDSVSSVEEILPAATKEAPTLYHRNSDKKLIAKVLIEGKPVDIIEPNWASMFLIVDKIKAYLSSTSKRFPPKDISLFVSIKNMLEGIIAHPSFNGTCYFVSGNLLKRVSQVLDTNLDGFNEDLKTKIVLCKALAFLLKVLPDALTISLPNLKEQAGENLKKIQLKLTHLTDLENQQGSAKARDDKINACQQEINKLLIKAKTHLQYKQQEKEDKNKQAFNKNVKLTDFETFLNEDYGDPQAFLNKIKKQYSTSDAFTELLDALQLDENEKKSWLEAYDYAYAPAGWGLFSLFRYLWHLRTRAFNQQMLKTLFEVRKKSLTHVQDYNGLIDRIDGIVSDLDIPYAVYFLPSDELTKTVTTNDNNCQNVNRDLASAVLSCRRSLITSLKDIDEANTQIAKKEKDLEILIKTVAKAEVAIEDANRMATDINKDKVLRAITTLQQTIQEQFSNFSAFQEGVEIKIADAMHHTSLITDGKKNKDEKTGGVAGNNDIAYLYSSLKHKLNESKTALNHLLTDFDNASKDDYKEALKLLNNFMIEKRSGFYDFLLRIFSPSYRQCCNTVKAILKEVEKADATTLGNAVEKINQALQKGVEKCWSSCLKNRIIETKLITPIDSRYHFFKAANPCQTPRAETNLGENPALSV